MPEPRSLDPARTRAIVLASGGLDAASTLEALRAHIEAARADGDVTLADGIMREIEAAGG